jgi:L,D-transpeptidase ErfK/SrfK
MRASFLPIVLFLAVGSASPPASHSGETEPLSLHAVYEVQPGQTLLDIARDHNLGYVEILAANPGVDPWLPGDYREIVLPTVHFPPDAPARGIVVNVGDMRLYFYQHTGGDPITYPIGVGRSGWELRDAATTVKGKRHWPIWFVPLSIQAEHPGLAAEVAPGPDNPLGEYSLDLRLPAVRIHGTNRPWGVGRRVSHGCIRLYPEAIAALFPLVAVGTPVTVVDQPVKLAWMSGDLWIEAHPTGIQADELEDHRPLTPAPVEGLEDKVADAAGIYADHVDWDAVHRAVAERRGYPVRILTPPP